MAASKINKEYQFNESETSVIIDNFSTYTDWPNSVFFPLKENIKSHLRVEQYNKCCYCKVQLGYDLKEVDIEHVIAKSVNEKFTFTSKNLALSCPGCNTTKSFKKVLLTNNDELRVRYPTSGTVFKIVHPHFDDYTKHIEILGKYIYSAITEKGSETITMCGLYRFRNVKQRALQHNVQIIIQEFKITLDNGKIISKKLLDAVKKLIK